jgi:hypothetical protein
MCCDWNFILDRIKDDIEILYSYSVYFVRIKIYAIVQWVFTASGQQLCEVSFLKIAFRAFETFSSNHLRILGRLYKY